MNLPLDSDLDFLCCSSTFHFFYFQGVLKDTALCSVALFCFISSYFIIFL